MEIPAQDETDTFRKEVPWDVGGDGILADKFNTFLIADKGCPILFMNFHKVVKAQEKEELSFVENSSFCIIAKFFFFFLTF
jgi:hypothetical protein